MTPSGARACLLTWSWRVWDDAASLLSAAGVPIEDISDTLGRRSVNVTAEIYRHPIALIGSGHMTAMNQLINTPPRSENPNASPENEDLDVASEVGLRCRHETQP